MSELTRIEYVREGGLPIALRYDEDAQGIWATQSEIAALFGVNRQAITKHIGNVLEDGELPAEGTCSKMELVAQEGGRTVRRTIDHYSLDMIIAVGYRVNSMLPPNVRTDRLTRKYLLRHFWKSSRSPFPDRGSRYQSPRPKRSGNTLATGLRPLRQYFGSRNG